MEIVIGPSVNTECVFGSPTSGEKRELKLRYYLAGSGANAYAAIMACNVLGSMIAFTGKPLEKEAETREELAYEITHMISKKVIAHEIGRGLKIETLPVLDHDHYAITKDGDGYTHGRKGNVIDHELAKKALNRYGNDDSLKFCTGIRPSEIELAQAMLGSIRGKRALNVKPDIMELQNLRNQILPYADFLFMNEKEFEISQMKMREIHELGVQFIAVTKGPHGVLWSFNNELHVEHGASVTGVTQPFTTGCGDWFAGIFLAALERLGSDFDNLSKEMIAKAVTIANITAAEKTRYSGSSNGPGTDFLDKLFKEI